MKRVGGARAVVVKKCGRGRRGGVRSQEEKEIEQQGEEERVEKER